MRGFKGNKTKKVILKKRTTETEEDFNTEVEDWDSNDKPLYAEKWDGSAKRTDNGQIVFVQDVRWRIRYQKDLNMQTMHNYRIDENGLQYDILNVEEIGRRQFQHLKTEIRDNR